MSERTPQDVLREAAEQALDRMTTAFDLLGPDMTANDREKLAQTLWFGKEELDKAIAEAPDSPDTLRQLVAQQAEDEGLWFVARTAPEAYLQQELRRLHAAIETPDILSEKPGLDVERLAEAIHVRLCAGPHMASIDQATGEETREQGQCDRDAPFIAREYDRLGSTDSEGR